MKHLLISSTKMGAATLGMALGLQVFYATVDWHPPNPVFWFFMGFNANLALELLEKFTGPSSAGPSAGFGELETVGSIDIKIKQYQDNIAGLRKILRVGSPQGKSAAEQKLQVATKNLNKWLQKRAALVGTA